MSRCLPVALVQAEPPPAGAPFERFAEDVETVLRRFPNTRLIVYPELHVYGTNATDPTLAEPLDGPRCAALTALAHRLGIWLVPGTLLETAEGGGVYNTAIVCSPTGELVAAYRKCFPWRPYEPYRPGTEFTVFDIPNVGRFGLSICYDTWFPELARNLAWLGAEAIIAPTRTTTSDRAQERILTRANAIANQVFVLSVNAAGPLGVGQSLIADPEGRVRVEAGRSPEVLTDVLDLDEVSKVRDYGTAGLNRIWAQFNADDSPLDLPAYGGRIDPVAWRDRRKA